jgi:N-hydroxyarylamine O-acetyltransferase
MNERAADYLNRIGFTGPIRRDHKTLAELQLAHLRSVPFENLHVFADRGVQTDDQWSYNKVVAEKRGGWCFEVNGAFAQLLESLGFSVRRLGAAVLLDGPNVVVDHLVLEVLLGEPYLVEVGFGDNAPIAPLPLNQKGPLDGGSGTFEFIQSPQGMTLTQMVDGLPEARYRFKRVNHKMADFIPASNRLQRDRSLHWSVSPFATRLLDDQGTRLTLTRSSLKTHTPIREERVPVASEDWNEVLFQHFGIEETFTPSDLEKTAP